MARRRPWRRWATGALLLPVLVAPPATPLAAQPAARSAAENALPPAVTDTGQGPETFVLVTGLVGGVGGFRRVRERLVAAGHRVVTIDPYHLSIDSADVTFDALARRVQRVLAEHRVGAARVVGHAHGGGVALRLAARAPEHVATLHLLDVGAQVANRGPVLGSSLRLVPLISRLPAGRRFVRSRFVRGLRQNSARHDWLDAVTQRAYTEPMLHDIRRVVAMAVRLGRAEEPEPLAAVIARIRAPVTLLLGAVPSPAGPSPEELAALAPLGAALRVEHLSGVAHFPHEEDPDEVVRRLLAPLAGRAARAPPHPAGVTDGR